MFHYKIFNEGKDKLLAIADSGVIGKTLKHGEVDIEVSDEFYGVNKCDHEKAIILAKSATIINAMGNDIIDLLTKNNIADKESVLLIDNIMHAQIVVSF